MNTQFSVLSPAASDASCVAAREPGVDRAGRRGAAGWAVALLLSALAVTAQAERADRDLPLEFNAGQLKIDGKRKLQLLTGGVEITRGTLILKADQIELRETPAGQLAVASGSEAQPATFRQKRDGLDEVIEGQARRIEYDTVSQTVRFSQQAQVRLLRAGVLADQISGQTIVYDHGRDAIEIQGGAADGSSGGRVRGIVTPRPADAAGVKR
ncbi:lipopolysaccharide transport periplasmic protein LptA [Leptothrix cholodnii SP-6]|uniref:Lipopolysaccharide export system protein LptA n=1 Tax=Leptothrix cholodnii (strain ATCC 51168 / LMG 8142 / SP-6) TaxID=395495 RepID=B1XYP2_LEPCP|nr:lipopolysaccharide transport periplasmic protein LptA [Leptothrix cholodnii]ACB36478.1 lipopolysaccharide transport periplasmic protein LptA [Leptothrix cholodnii SP-6]